jgi:quercetin dioxygenase-like cupin family protein
MYFLDAETRATKELAPGVTAKTFWGDKMLLSEVTIQPGCVVPLHSHPHEQSGVVLEGELSFTIGGETRIVHPGDMYIIPGGVEHTVTALKGIVKVLDIFSPVREEYKY